MIKKILFLTIILSLVILAGCAKQIEEQKEVSTDSTGMPIEETDSISNDLEDIETEKELDSIETTLSNW